MRIAIYNRVSTGKQDPENQAVQLHKFTKTQRSWAITHEFTDVVSGTKGEKDRPQFKRMMEAASKHEFDLVLFWALDRFSREGTLPTLHHLQRLDSFGVAWKSYTEQYLDSTGMFKDAVIAILAVIAKQRTCGGRVRPVRRHKPTEAAAVVPGPKRVSPSTPIRDRQKRTSEDEQ